MKLSFHQTEDSWLQVATIPQSPCIRFGPARKLLRRLESAKVTLALFLTWIGLKTAELCSQTAHLTNISIVCTHFVLPYLHRGNAKLQSYQKELFGQRSAMGNMDLLVGLAC